MKQHSRAVRDRLRDIEGIEVRRVGDEDLIVAVFSDPKKMTLDEVFHGVCHHLKGQAVEFKRPDKSVVEKHFANRVTTVRAVQGEETPPTLNLWMRLANDNDIRGRQLHVGEILHGRFFGGVDGEEKRNRGLLKALAGGIVISALSRSKLFQSRVLR